MNRPIEEKESLRWLEGYRCVCDLQWGLAETRLVYVADRESDLFELFEQGRSGEAAWLIRASYDRKLSDGRHLWQAVRETEVLGMLELDLAAAPDPPARHVVQTLRAARVKLRPPSRVGSKLSEVEVTAILAWEEPATRSRAGSVALAHELAGGERGRGRGEGTVVSVPLAD